MTAKQSIIEAAHENCQRVYELHRPHITIDDEAAQALACSLSGEAEAVRKALRGLALPVRYDDLQQEVNLLALYHMLDGGSGYNPLLLQRCRRDAHETLQFGIIGLHMGGGRLDAKWLKNFSLQGAHNFFGIDSMDEHEVMPGVTMSKPGVLHAHAKALVNGLSETGSILVDLGQESLGAFIVSFLTARKAKGPLLASDLIDELCDSLPAFADNALYDGKKVVYARKAQELAASLHVRFGGSDARFCFSDFDRLCADSGSVVPAVLRAKGVLKLSEELSNILDAGEELPSGPHERALRAAAVVACDKIVALSAASAAGTALAATSVPGEAAAGTSSGDQKVHSGEGSTVATPFNAVQLGAYLVSLAEDNEELRGVIKPHLTKCFAY